MDKEIDKKEILEKYTRKRNLILFLVVFPTFLIIGSLLIFYFFNLIEVTHLVTIYLPLIIIDTIVVVLLAPRVNLYNMYVDFSKITLNEPHFLKTHLSLFTSTWITKLNNEGYELVQEDMTHMLLCKYYKKLPAIANSDDTLVFITIAKNNQFDFYSEIVDSGIQSVYLKNKKYRKITKQITLQFKKYTKVDDQVTADIETAILYKVGKQVLVNLSFAYLKDQSAVYSLNPAGKFPNKYVYFAFKETNRLCGII